MQTYGPDFASPPYEFLIIGEEKIAVKSAINDYKFYHPSSQQSIDQVLLPAIRMVCQ